MTLIQSQPQHIAEQQSRGFTLVELTLTIVIGSLVLMGATGVFIATRNMDRIFGLQYDNTTQLHITQMTIRRSLLSLQVQEDQRPTVGSAQANATDTQTADQYPRVILEPDPIYADLDGPWQPQRFEVVLSTPPIALNMASKAAAWARINDRDDSSLDFSSTDASGGVLRSVYELRPNGSRERIMRSVDLLDPDPVADQHLQSADTKPTGWTLWWRPILRTEAQFLQSGGNPLTDSAGTDDEIRYRLAGAIPLVQNIDICSWTIYKADEHVNSYQATAMSSLPAYVEFELLLTSGQYATWMFEVDWVTGDDPLEIQEDDQTNDQSDDAEDNPDDNSEPGGGGLQGPGQDNQFDMNGRNQT